MDMSVSPARPVVARHFRRAFLSALAMLALAGCGSRAADQQGQPPPPTVSVATVLEQSVRQWDEFTGRVEAVETVELRPRVSGYIEKIVYQEGQEVERGDVLFVIDARSYRAEVERAQAELERAQTQAALARSELARANKLAAAQAISAEELDQRRSAVDQSAANVRAAEAAVDVARLDLEYTQVRAPISGRAGRAMITTGNLAQADATLLTTIVSLDPVYVYFESDEQTYLSYDRMARENGQPGARDARHPVRVGLASERGHPHQGYLDFVDNQVDAATGTIRARAVVSNADRLFTPGLFARVQLRAASEVPALLIDEKAVLTDQDRKYVYVLGPENTALRKDVVLGRTAGRLRIVESGLEAGDRVIVHGVQKVFFAGMPVVPQMIAMGDPPSAPLAALSPGPRRDATGVQHGSEAATDSI